MKKFVTLPVEGATSYEIQITIADGTSKTYTTEDVELIIKLGREDFIKGCPKKLIRNSCR